MNKHPIIPFAIGIILTLTFVLILKPFKEEVIVQEEVVVKEIYTKLVELGYAKQLGEVTKDTEEEVKYIIKEIKTAAEWVPEGDIKPEDVVSGKTFYNSSREKQTGTYTPEEFEFLGDAIIENVLLGNKFYSHSNELLTGTLTLPILPSVTYSGNASANEVLSGKTFYSDSGTLLTGTLTIPTTTYSGNALANEVFSGRTFYSDSGSLLTGTWQFLGDATVNDVLLGKNFYSNTGTLLTGVYSPFDYSTMQYVNYDDYAGGDYLTLGGTLTNDYQGEESEWTRITDNIWKDEKTEIYWSSDQTGTMEGGGHPASNSFDMSTCSFFTSSPRGSYAGSDTDCGNAINYCATLSLDGRTNWYLPSQKELMSGYLDGIYNSAGTTEAAAASFTSGNVALTGTGTFWSSTEQSTDSTYAWHFDMVAGYSFTEAKTWDAYGVRCISRD